MLTLEDLLGSNYLPHELPPCFTSLSFAQRATELKKVWGMTRSPLSRPVRFNLARHGTLRRQLSIPNPVHQLHVADLIRDHWDEIDLRIDRAPSLSESRPVLRATDGTREFRAKHTFRNQPDLRARERAGMRYALRADIARFYPSIYTHSIEWAIHGKAATKSALQHGVGRGWGKDLDKAVRSGQDNETMGIPIGPITSAVIAELVLSEVDQGLPLAASQFRGFRYTDDYELTFVRRDAAESALLALQDHLGAFNLHLNPLKTQIVALPLSLDTPWSAHLKGMFFRPSVRDERRDLLRLFDIAVDLAARHPNEQVQKYALGILQHGVSASPANWPLVQGWLLQCLMAEPGTAETVLKELIRYERMGGRPVDKALLSDTLQRLIGEHVPQGHSSEVAWGLWGMIEFKLPIDVQTARDVVAMDDAIVALLALACHHEFGIWPAGVDFGPYANFMTRDDLYSERWILAYEAMTRVWLPPVSSSDDVMNDPHFHEMAVRGVTFFDHTQRLSPGNGPGLPFWLGSSGP